MVIYIRCEVYNIGISYFGIETNNFNESVDLVTRLEKVFKSTGLRIFGLLNIKIEDINLENKTINIPDSKTKNGIRVLPIHDKLMPLIEKRYGINNKHYT